MLPKKTRPTGHSIATNKKLGRSTITNQCWECTTDMFTRLAMIH